MRQRTIKIRLRSPFPQQSIFFSGIVGVSYRVVLSVVVNVLDFVYFLDILVLEHESVEDNIVINL